MKLPKILAVASAALLASAGFAAPAFAEELNVPAEAWFTDSCGDVVAPGEYETVKRGWTFHWATEAAVPQDLDFALYDDDAPKRVLVDKTVEKGTIGHVAWQVSGSVSIVGGYARYAEGEIPVYSAGTIEHEDLTVDYLVNAGGQDFYFRVQGEDTRCASGQPGSGAQGSEVGVSGVTSADGKKVGSTSPASETNSASAVSGTNGVLPEQADKQAGEESAELANTGSAGGILGGLAAALVFVGLGGMAVLVRRRS